MYTVFTNIVNMCMVFNENCIFEPKGCRLKEKKPPAASLRLSQTKLLGTGTGPQYPAVQVANTSRLADVYWGGGRGEVIRPSGKGSLVL